MKKALTIAISMVILMLSLVLLELKLPHSFESIDAKLHDFLFLARGVEKPSDDIVIVDIDETSLKKFGQWPWSRNVVAHLIDNLTFAGAGIIGLDIVFAEADRSSPAHIIQELGLHVKELKDYDAMLAQSINNAPVIGGYFFNFEHNSTVEGPSIPAIFLEKGRTDSELGVPTSTGITLNIPSIQNAFYSVGFFNNMPDEGGIIRSVPLIIRYDMSLYPSLALEMIRIYSQTQKVYVNNSHFGVESVTLNNITIPTDSFGRLRVNFKGPGHTYRYISADKILEGDFNPSEIEGKFVLIGTSAIGLVDLRATPFDEVMPGVELHANTIDTILSQNFLIENIDTHTYNTLILLATILLTTLIFALISEWLYLPLIALLLLGAYYINMYVFFTLGLVINILFPLAGMLLSMFSVLLIEYIFTSSQKRELQKAFAKKVSPQVMHDIIEHSTTGLLTPKEREVSIFFSDIRSFTNISEKIGHPNRLIAMLNEYMTPMVDIVIAHHGTVDKFIGDAVMAYWNAPVEVKNHQDRAVQAALEQLDKLKELNVHIQKVYDVTIDIGIGIHSGVATIGEMGSEGRSDYTIIGDNVNLASRLEGLCKPYGVRLIISEFTKKGLKERYIIRELDIVRVKGKEHPVTIYEVIDKGEADDTLEIELHIYQDALCLYREAKFSDAKTLFETLHNSYHHSLYAMYASRCENLIESGIKEFDGIYTFTTK